MPLQAGGEHLDPGCQGLRSFGHARHNGLPPGAHTVDHDFIQCLVAVATRNRAQSAGDPVTVEVVHAEEFVVHALRDFFCFVGVAAINGVAQPVEGAALHFAQLFFGE